MMGKRDIVISGILSVVIGILYVSGLPLGSIPCTFADIQAGGICGIISAMRQDEEKRNARIPHGK